MRSLAMTVCTVAFAVLAVASCTADTAALVSGPARPAAAQALPPGHPVTSASDAVPPVPPGTGTGATGLTWTASPGWKAETPSSSMRRAQYRVPGPGGDAELVVFYFGPGQGGDALSNATRWAGQFRQPDGRDPAAAMKTSEIEVRGLKVTLVEVTGTYSGGMGGTAGEKAGYQLLGAIAVGPDANWFFKLTGPEKTVTAQRAAFEGLIRSLKKGS